MNIINQLNRANNDLNNNIYCVSKTMSLHISNNIHKTNNINLKNNKYLLNELTNYYDNNILYKNYSNSNNFK